MDVLKIPFHKFLNIEKYTGDDYLFELKEKPEHLNHLKTIHACVQLTLAEASSGEFLLREFADIAPHVIPVIRKTEAKYHRPANGTLYSRASFHNSPKEEILEDLVSKQRSIAKIKVEVFDVNKNRVLTVVFDWFLKMN